MTKGFNSPSRLMMNIAEKCRADIQRLYPEDKVANKIACDMLYHFAWKVKDEEDAQQNKQ